MIQSIEALLERHEGLRLKPYLCTAGKLTIGIGRNLDDRGITEDEARYLLRNDIAKALASLRHEPYWLDLNEPRQAVLIDMVVNLGWAGWSQFKNMRAALNRLDYLGASYEMRNSKWYTQVGSRGIRLRQMMESGAWPLD